MGRDLRKVPGIRKMSALQHVTVSGVSQPPELTALQNRGYYREAPKPNTKVPNNAAVKGSVILKSMIGSNSFAATKKPPLSIKAKAALLIVIIGNKDQPLNVSPNEYPQIFKTKDTLSLN